MEAMKVTLVQVDEGGASGCWPGSFPARREEPERSATRIGRHVLTFEAPDLLLVELHGDVSVTEMDAFVAFTRAIAEGRPYLFAMADIGDLGAVPPEARKGMSRETRDIPYRGMAFYHGKLFARAVMRLLLGAIRLMAPHRDNPMVFVPTAGDARAWIAARRNELASAPSSTSGS